MKPDVTFIDLTCIKIDNIVQCVIIALAFRQTSKVQLCARLDSGSLGDSELKKHCFWNTFDFYSSLAGKENEKREEEKATVS